MSIDFAGIRAGVDLVELVASHGVELRKSGSQFVGLCPFHTERTPSFYVHSERGFYCHGCDAKGDALDFIRMIDGLTLDEALERLGQDTTAAKPCRPRATVRTEPTRDAAVLWARLAEHDGAVGVYLAGRGLLYRDPDVLRFNVGASGDRWLDEKAGTGYRVAFAVRNALGQVQTLSLRRVSEDEPKKLSLAGCPTSGAAIVSPGIEQLAGGDPEFAADRVLVLEGGTSWLGAAALFSQASADYGSAPAWPLGAIGVSQAAGAVSAFAAVVRWRTVLVGLDADEAGRKAAPDVEEAARKAGARDVIRAEAPGAKDWAELCLSWQKERASA
ncbi:MAG TPA: CHC2 zinc finger domain-containing protein [Polyangiaceae bacterium]